MPQVGSAPANSPPPVPADAQVVCLVDPNLLTNATSCPVITCGGLTYWMFSYLDSRVSMDIVGYRSQSVAYQSARAGARYIYKITVDNAAQTVTLVGQSSATIVVPWNDLWP